MSEDPIKDGTNWYSYCAGNPVMFVDSSGMFIEIMGYSEMTVDQKNLVFDALDAQTDYALTITETGIVQYNGTLKDSESVEHPTGNVMMSTLLSSENGYKINFDQNGDNSYDSNNNIITFNGSTTKYRCVGSESVAIIVKTDPEDGMQHELVHAYRDEVKVMAPDGEERGGVPLEELQTVGLTETDWNGHTPITENILRNEGDKALRIKYGKVN